MLGYTGTKTCEIVFAENDGKKWHLQPFDCFDTLPKSPKNPEGGKILLPYPSQADFERFLKNNADLKDSVPIGQVSAEEEDRIKKYVASKQGTKSTSQGN
jgi:hypothetical protein